MRKIGLLISNEWSWPHLFVREVHRQDRNVVAEYVPLAGLRLSDKCNYDLVIDRVSLWMDFLRPYLKSIMLQGVHVINNAFTWELDDKFNQALFAKQIGINSPKTVLLPNKDYLPTIDHNLSLRNLAYPLPWQQHIDYLGGFPLILKDARGLGWENVFVIENLEQLFHCYDQTGLRTMILQEYIKWDQYIRCICFGQKDILVIKYDPNTRRYLEADFSTELHQRLVTESLKLVKALEMDMMSIEWAVRDDVLYAIDFLNYNPDLDVAALGFDLQKKCISKLSETCREILRNPQPQRTPLRAIPVNELHAVIV